MISRQTAAAAASAGLRGPNASAGLRGPNAVAPAEFRTEKGELYRNFGDGFTRAFELAVTPVIFGAVGYWFDGRLGIRPILTLVLTLLAIVGLLLRTWYGYVYRMQKLEETGPWARRGVQATQAGHSVQATQAGHSVQATQAGHTPDEGTA